MYIHVSKYIILYKSQEIKVNWKWQRISQHRKITYLIFFYIEIDRKKLLYLLGKTDEVLMVGVHVCKFAVIQEKNVLLAKLFTLSDMLCYDSFCFLLKSWVPGHLRLQIITLTNSYVFFLLSKMEIYINILFF